MQIRSKKTGVVHYISKEGWEVLKSDSLHRKYDVLDEEDEIVQKPIDIEPVNILDGERQQYKDLLDELGVEYHPNMGIKKLKELYEQNRENGTDDDEHSDEVL